MNGLALEAFDQVMVIAADITLAPAPIKPALVEELGQAVCTLKAQAIEGEASLAESAFGLAACLVTEMPDSIDAVKALHHTRMVVLRERAAEKQETTPQAAKLEDWQKRKDTGS